MEKRIPVIIPAYEPDEKMIRLLQTAQTGCNVNVLSADNHLHKIIIPSGP